MLKRIELVFGVRVRWGSELLTERETCLGAGVSDVENFRLVISYTAVAY